MSIANQHKLTQWEEVRKKLTAWEIRFFTLRVEGHTYENCAVILRKEFPKMQKLKSKVFNDMTLRNSMRTKGRLRPAYEIYRSMVAEENAEASLNTLRMATHAAAATEVSLLRSKQDHVKLNAAEAILNRVHGKASLPVEVRDDSELEELRQKLDKLSEPDENITRLSKRIKNNKKGAGQS
jgi:hypothetical protein